MKQLKTFSALLLLLLLSGCWGYGTSDDMPPLQQNYDAIVMDRDAFENSVAINAPQPVVKSGKIYVKGNLLFVNDVNKGFHIYNCSNPDTMVPVAFLNIPGATDLAMRDDAVYINQAVDLVTLIYNEQANTITVTKRNKNVFPQKLPPDNSYEAVSENEVIVDWQQI